MSSIHGLILCGGKSTRMEQDKATVQHKGKSLLQYAIETFQAMQIDFHLSVNAYQKNLLEKYNCIVDQYENKGPLGGILSALNELQTDLLVIPVDMPELSTQLIRKLLDAPENHELVRCFQLYGRLEPFPSLWKTKSATSMEQFMNEDELSLQKCISRLPHQLLQGEDSGDFVNLNWPSDLG